MITQQSGTHADLGGLVEYGSDGSLPVVFEFVGTLDLNTGDISIEESNHERNRYGGSVSDNGRVITLRSITPDGTKAKPFHLIHEQTLTQLDAD